MLPITGASLKRGSLIDVPTTFAADELLAGDVLMPDFDLRWLSDQMDKSFEKLEERLDDLCKNMATKGELEVVRAQVEGLVRRVDALEDAGVVRDAVESHAEAQARNKRDWLRWVLPLLATVVLAAATIVSLLH